MSGERVLSVGRGGELGLDLCLVLIFFRSLTVRLKVNAVERKVFSFICGFYNEIQFDLILKKFQGYLIENLFDIKLH